MFLGIGRKTYAVLLRSALNVSLLQTFDAVVSQEPVGIRPGKTVPQNLARPKQ